MRHFAGDWRHEKTPEVAVATSWILPPEPDVRDVVAGADGLVPRHRVIGKIEGARFYPRKRRHVVLIARNAGIEHVGARLILLPNTAGRGTRRVPDDERALR